jgi:hypothetical protein
MLKDALVGLDDETAHATSIELTRQMLFVGFLDFAD